MNENFTFFFDDYLFFRGVMFSRGWAFHVSGEPVDVTVNLPGGIDVPLDETSQQLPSKDLPPRYGENSANARFDFHLAVEAKVKKKDYPKISITFTCGEEVLVIDEPQRYKMALDQFYVLGNACMDEIKACEGARVLEIGARARSKISRRKLFPEHLEYVGFDIMDGENVDVVGDAHALSQHFKKDSFDYVFSLATFEHIFMPWLVALEINKILKVGGQCYISAPQAWPTHDEPWDYFRFSSHAWHALFNEATGFELLRTEMGEPALMLPLLHNPDVDLDNQVGWLNSACLVKKIGRSKLKWPVKHEELIADEYPA
jgi:SAM-dependent methyltransferase